MIAIRVMAERSNNNPLDVFSGIERQIADYLVAGMNSSEISKRLSISYQSVAETSRLIKQKLNVSTVTDLRKLAGRQD